MESLKEVEFGLEIDQLEKYLNNREIAMIGLLDGIGYSPNGYNYLHKIMASIKLDAKRLTVFNAHFRTFNKEQYIEDMLAANVSLLDIKKLQYQENQERINEILREKNLPKDKKLARIIRSVYKIKENFIAEEEYATKLKDTIQDYEDVNIFYSANNFLLNKSTTYGFIKQEKEQRRRNYHSILSMNPKAQIYTIGLIPPRKKNSWIQEDTRELNAFYQELASEFGMIYIDTTGLEHFLKKDITGYHLNQEGIDILAFRSIQAMYQRKIKNKINPSLNIQTREINNKYSGLEALLSASIKREMNFESELKAKEAIPTWKENFLRDNIMEEQAKQKIYKKAKEGYFE